MINQYQLVCKCNAVTIWSVNKEEVFTLILLYRVHALFTNDLKSTFSFVSGGWASTSRSQSAPPSSVWTGIPTTSSWLLVHATSNAGRFTRSTNSENFSVGQQFKIYWQKNDQPPCHSWFLFVCFFSSLYPRLPLGPPGFSQPTLRRLKRNQAPHPGAARCHLELC